MDKKENLPISVCICTLNCIEEIKNCLEAVFRNNISEVIVVDAESNDGTFQFLRSQPVKLISCPRLGLAYQRQLSIENASKEFIAIVDSQDVLEDDCLAVLLAEMKLYRWHAIQASTHAKFLDTYWQRAYNSFTKYSLNEVGETNMVGRPCIYKSKSILEIGFDPFFSFGVGCEDADISIQFEKKSYKQGMGSGIVKRVHPKYIGQWFKKWAKYGRGDACLIFKYPYKTFGIIKHQLITYPILRSYKLIRRNQCQYAPFYILTGIVRFTFMLKKLFKLLIKI